MTLLRHMCGDQRTTWVSWCFLSTIWFQRPNSGPQVCQMHLPPESSCWLTMFTLNVNISDSNSHSESQNYRIITPKDVHACSVLARTTEATYKATEASTPPRTGKMAHLWGSLDSQPGLLSKLQASGRSCLTKQSGQHLRKDTQVVLWYPHAPTHVHKCLHANALIHTWTCTQTEESSTPVCVSLRW